MAGIGSSGFGPGGSQRFQGFRHGSLDGRNNTFRYPSPWWDVATMDLPRSVKHLFKWCRYHMLVNPLVAAVTRKMAQYPITKVVIDDEPADGFDKHKNRWEECLYRTLNIARFQNEVGLDYYAYGNCIVSVMYPFHKHLQCKKCNFKKRIKRLKFRSEWDFKEMRYVLKCPNCAFEGHARVKDEFYKSYKDIKLVRWNPSDIDIDFNPITRKAEYAYNIPAQVRTRVIRKRQSYLEDLPKIFIDAMRHRRPVVLTRENIFHFKTPTPSLAANDEGWGYPMILPALKDSFYLQIMKKAQEAVMLEHLIPLDILFPASADANANPYLTINLADWKRRIEAEIVKWKWDPNYKPIMPIPIGHQRIGGNGRALMLTQEIRAWSEHIIAGMGVPQEFAFGGLSWSGSNVSMRMLENQFLNYREMHQHFLQHFLIPNIARFMGWKETKVHMKAFKMADDMQSKQLMLSLNQLQKLSDKSLLAEFDKDALDELRLIEQELRRRLEIQKLDTLYKATIQGEAQVVGTKYQIKSQEAMTASQQKMEGEQAQAQQGQEQAAMEDQQAQEQENSPKGVNVIELSEAWAKKLVGMEDQEAAAVLQQMSSQMPQLHQLVQQKLNVMKALNQEPLPEQRAPRRANALI